MIWKEKERYSIKAVLIEDLRCLLGIKGMIRELRRVKKGVDKRYGKGIDKGGKSEKIAKRFTKGVLLIVIQWVGHRKSGLTS